MALTFTSLTDFKARLGATASDAVLTHLLAGVESLIQTAVRSPVALTAVAEWAAPVADPRLILRWRPVNVAGAGSAAVDPAVVSYPTRFATTGGTALTYGTDFVVSDLDGGDGRFGLAGMLEAIGGGASWGWGGGWGGVGSWGGAFIRPPTRLSPTLTSDRGRLRVTYWAGWPDDAIPPVLAEAAYLEAATLWRMRKFGQLLQSESLAEYSYSLGSPGVVGARQGATGTFSSAAAAGMLQKYLVPAIAGVSPW